MTIGKRLQWTREKLKLSQKHVYTVLQISQSVYHGYENDRIGNNYETFFRISQMFDELWQARYPQIHPQMNDRVIKEITFTWVILGKDPYREKYDRNLGAAHRDMMSIANRGQ